MPKIKKNRLPPFVYLTKEMLQSPAFKKLTNSARVTYLLLQSQNKSANQAKVIFSYKQAAEYMDRHTFSKAIKQLSNYGFIEISQFGGLYRRTNEYKFVEAWRSGKT